MTRYYYLKLGNSNSLAEYWLSENNVVGHPAAAIYFGICKAEAMEELYEIHNLIKPNKKKEPNDAKENELKKLIERWEEKGKNEITKREQQRQIVDFLKAVHEKHIFVTITPRKIYFYKAIGELKTLPEGKFDKYDKDLEEIKNKRKDMKDQIDEMKINGRNHFPKYVEVKIIKEEEFGGKSEVPFILRSLSANQGYNRRTCVHIKDEGVTSAIEYCLNGKQFEPHNATELFECLSPLEFETLIFLLLMESGLHVFTWRGGTLKGIDLVAKNVSSEVVTLGNISISPGDTKAFQIKRKRKYDESVPDYVDYVVALSCGKKKNEKCLDADWVKGQIKRVYKENGDSIVFKWLKNSLWWVSEESIFNIIMGEDKPAQGFYQ